MVSVAPELKRRSKSYGDLSLKRTFDHYKNETSPYLSRRHSSCIEEQKCLSLVMLYQWTKYINSKSNTLHESNIPKDQNQRSLKQIFLSTEKATHPSLLPSMDIPNHHTWHSSSTHQHHQSKDIISAIIAAAKYPENASFGWVGIEEEQTLDTRPNSPPPPPLPIENDTHIFDLLALDDNAYFIHYSQRADQPSAMNSATVEKLVEILTKGMDSDLMMNFFLTFRQFLTPIKLCKLLILRFRWALLEDSDDRRLVRIRTFVVLRYWITHYWEHDFIMSRTLRFMLCTFLSQLRTHPVILNSPRDARIIKNLRNILKRQRKLYSTNFDSSARATLCSNHAQLHQRDDHTASTSLSPWLRWYRDSSTSPVSTSSSCSPQSIMDDTSTNHWIKSSPPRHQLGTPAGKKNGNQKQTNSKGLRSSTSTPTLPFLGRSRRLSACSQRSVHEENAWTAKMNFGIKTIKRTVPTIYQSLINGITINNNNMNQKQQHQFKKNKQKCTCKLPHSYQQHSLYQHFLPHRYPQAAIMRSASRLFDQRSPSMAESMIHNDSTCPYYSSTQKPTFPTSTFSSSSCHMLSSSLSSSSSSSSTTAAVSSPNTTPTPSPLTSSHGFTYQPLQRPQQHLRRASYYSDGASTTRTTRTTATCGRTVSSLPTCLDDYRPFILTFRSEVIAQQFCMMEQEMLQWVTWDELAELRWRKRSKGTVISPDIEQSSLQDGVEQLIGFFNKTCQWVASEIVRTRSMDIRIRVIEKFIRIALKCYHHRNYSTLMQILLGLQAPAVSRLEKTWQRIDHYEMQIFNELKELAKPFRNWKNVRDAMTKAIHEIAESSAVESVLTKDIFDDDNVDGCIPFLGLYLSDLVFNAELPTFIDSTKLQHTMPKVSPEDEELCRRLGSHLVNYNKFRITATIIKHILAFQVLCRAYHFDPHPGVLLCLQKMQLLDSIEIRKHSGLCEQDP